MPHVSHLDISLVQAVSPPILNMVTVTPAAGRPEAVSRMCEDTGSGCDLTGPATVLPTEDPTSGSCWGLRLLST